MSQYTSRADRDADLRERGGGGYDEPSGGRRASFRAAVKKEVHHTGSAMPDKAAYLASQAAQEGHDDITAPPEPEQGSLFDANTNVAPRVGANFTDRRGQ
jgi:hypothetical protein